MSSIHTPTPCVRLAPLLALLMVLAMGVPAASAQNAPRLWSIQLHGGLFAPIEATGASPTVGMRYCKHYSPYLQAGLLTGWTFKSQRSMAPADGVQGSESEVEVARANASLVPVMGFLQVNLTEKFWLVPLIGIGAGYEWLLLDSKDYRTGQESKAHYGSVAWEAYGGVALATEQQGASEWGVVLQRGFAGTQRAEPERGLIARSGPCERRGNTSRAGHGVRVTRMERRVASERQTRPLDVLHLPPARRVQRSGVSVTTRTSFG